MKSLRVVVGLVVVLVLVFPAAAEDGLEQEVASLVRTLDRLVQVVERQEQARAGNESLERVGLAVQILDIRARQREALQKELRGLEDREQRARGYIATRETKLQTIEKQFIDAVDEAKRAELEAQRREFEVYLANQKTQLEHYSQRRVDLENRLMAGERLTRDVEGIVEAWVEELQNPTPAHRGN